MMSSRLLLALTVVGLAACGEVSNPTVDAPVDVPITIDAPGPDALDIDAPPIDAPAGTRTVTVSKAGTGTGAVTSSAGGINCGGVCAAAVPDGTTLTLTAAPDVGTSFDGWGGACASAGTATTCTLTITADVAISATFTRQRYPITVALAGNGLGTVASSPAGINCPGTCSATVDHGTTMTLTATPSGGSTFLGWSGACSGTGACVITATAAASVTATFAQNQSLVVTKAGAGTGTVTSSPAGINCGADCSEAYAPGTTVTLTATPTGASTFQGWSGGGCTGTAPTCTVTVTGAVMVTATFGAPQCTLTVVKAGTGSGTVTSSPAGIACGTDCTETVACGTAIVLTAAPAGTATFAGWSGACTGTGACTAPMTSDTTITATFNAAVVTPNLVFVTSTTHTGNLGGLAGADAICQARASAAGRAGTYRAWLSTSATSAISRLGSASGWTLVDGRPFANTTADLAAGRVFYPITLDETGASQAFASAWTATIGAGTWNTLDNACTNWTSTTPSGVTAGSTLGTSDSWTANTGNPCTATHHLYCFGVDRAATVTVTPATGRRIFMTSATWTPGGGIASADAVCASEASSAGLTGTFRALLATTTASAASRFGTTGATWVRADGIAITTTAAELFAAATSAYRVVPNQTANGAYVTASPRRYLWSGATSLTATGTAASTCSDWTSTSSTVMPQLAELNTATPSNLFGGIGYLTCATAQRLMCLQQ